MTTETAAPRRNDFSDLLQRGDLARAIARAGALLRDDSSPRQVSRIGKTVARAIAGGAKLEPWKVALLSSFSIEFIHDALVTQGFLNGLGIEIYQAGFDQYRQELLDPESGLYRFEPQAVVLAVAGRSWLPMVYEHYLAALDRDVAAQVAEAARTAESLVKEFRSRSRAPLLIHNAALPDWPRLGTIDGRLGMRQSAALSRFNELLDDLARQTPGTYVVDYASLVQRYGARHWYDPRMTHLARAPIAADKLFTLAGEYLRFFRAMTGRSKKCLVLDLDNTLWGGVLGEDGPDGIALGPDYPGSAFMQFQREVLALRDRGVILAVASKNNRDEVEELFRTHPHMLLKLEHFSALEVNWEPKSRSLANIARQLNIGPEHLVFVDDSPAECAEVSEALPAVATFQLPRQPELFGRQLDEAGLFDVLSLSEEDRQRGELYRQRALAAELQAGASSLEDYYRQLQMELAIAPVTSQSLPRAAQLTQKTNQFNLTTIRYSESQLHSRLGDPEWIMATVGVKDRFGDNGIVGVMFARSHDDALEIDTFLLSCRVIGRTIETAMLAWLCQEAVRRGHKRLEGKIVPTPKNVPARDLYSRHGFAQTSDEGAAGSLWTLDPTAAPVAWPEWLKAVEGGK